jgi:uncharacterized protein YlzI (FlbEa/FlbD family)
MKIETITFSNDLEYIEDIFDYNTDVAVQLEDGHKYIVVVATQKNLLTLMDNEKSDFLSPGDPMIIVRKFTKEVVQKAIEAYAKNQAYYLKFYAADLDIKTLNVLNDRYIARSKFLDDLLEKGESIDIENYDLIDFKYQ